MKTEPHLAPLTTPTSLDGWPPDSGEATIEVRNNLITGPPC